MTDILATIIEQKRLEISRLDLPAMRAAAQASPLPRDFLAALRRPNGLPLALIAELKRASPSKGLLAPHLDLFQVAELYSSNGASAISVLTDEKFFLGQLDTLRQLRFTRASALPLLRKDFMIDEIQLYETRANGADAVLLIAAAITDDIRLAELHACALSLNLTPLVEVHNEAETERALRLPGIKLIGINNRDLATFEVSLSTTQRLRPIIPAGILVVAESGIFTAADIARLAQLKVDAALVGEALITAPDIASKVRELSGFGPLP